VQRKKRNHTTEERGKKSAAFKGGVAVELEWNSTCVQLPIALENYSLWERKGKGGKGGDANSPG